MKEQKEPYHAISESLNFANTINAMWQILKSNMNIWAAAWRDKGKAQSELYYTAFENSKGCPQLTTLQSWSHVKELFLYVKTEFSPKDLRSEQY